MTEREKQLQGLPYVGGDCELKAMQYKAQNLVKKINALDLEDEDERKKLVGCLFGHAGKNLRIYPPKMSTLVAIFLRGKMFLSIKGVCFWTTIQLR